MTRNKMSEIYVAALRKAFGHICPDFEASCYQCTHYIELSDRIAARIVDRMMARPTRSVAELRKKHGLKSFCGDTQEIEATKRCASDITERELEQAEERGAIDMHTALVRSGLSPVLPTLLVAMQAWRVLVEDK